METFNNLAIFIQDTLVRTLNSAIVYPETIPCSAAKLGQIRECLPGNKFFYFVLDWKDSSACASSPCGHYGTCIDTCTEGSGFKCICTEERTGDKCQDNKSE